MLSRRRFLLVAGAVATGVLAACAGAIRSIAPTPSASAAATPVPSTAPPASDPGTGLRERIGQMLMVGFRGRTPAEAEGVLEDIAERGLGAVILFSRDQLTGGPRNVESPEQLGELTAALREAATRVPLIVAVDQEGGQVARLGPLHGFPASPSAAELGAANDLGRTAAEARATADLLVAAGITLNLAPVVDLAVNPANPIIAAVERSYGADAGLVTAHARAVIEAHHAVGVRCAIKHFPGHGSSAGDTHLGVVDVTGSWTDVELEPFASLAGAGLADAVLTAHVFNARLDPDHPATLSRATVEGRLRGGLGFDGPVLSDDLQMGAIRDAYGFDEAVALAIEAGVDLLVVANQLVYEPDVAARMIDVIEEHVRSGRISEVAIDVAVGRVARLRVT